MNKPSLKFIALAEFIMAAGISLFWLAYFTGDVVHIDDPRLKETYQAFESAFPLADSWLILSLIAGGTGLLKRKSYGTLFTLLAGSALLFLGLVDASFNTIQGIYSLGGLDGLLNLFINLLCIGAGILFITSAWDHRNT